MIGQNSSRAATNGGDFLCYDGQCPVCSRYVEWTRLRARHPHIKLIDARANPTMVAQLKADGIDINDTMVLQIDGRRYIGAAALAQINRYIEPKSVRERVTKAFTKSQSRLEPIYPALVCGRKLLLRLLGRAQIR